MSPITGAEGAEGGVFITASADFTDVQPWYVTVKLYVPGERPAIVVLVPVPVIVPPGVLVRVHSPPEGSPVICTLPVGVAQVG